MGKVQISAVIITFNEERNIRRCLESLRDIPDEIVVVDSYSTDGTESICEEFGVRFIRHRFAGHIEQKNWAILQTSYPYILSLDADEALSDELRYSIQKVKENWTHDGYYFNRLTNYCGKWIRHTSWYPSRKLRLWDSRKGSWGGFNPHDRFFLTRGASKQFLKGDILHYSYYSVSEHLDQINAFSTIIARSYYNRRRRVNNLIIVMHPVWRFFKDFFVRMGFMDGYYGFIVSVNSAHEVFLKYVKLKNIYRDEKQSQKRVVCLFNSQSTWGGGEKWHADVAVQLKKQGIPVRYFSAPGSPLARRMEEIGIKGFQKTISNLSFLNPIKVLNLARLMRTEKVGSIVMNLSGDMKIASNAARIAGVPKIIYRRGSAIPIRDTPLNRYLFRKVITGIIANSMEVKRTILFNNERLVPEDKITIIYNGVNLERFKGDAAPIYIPQNGEIVLGCAGRLSEEKGHMHLLDLMKNLSGSPFRFKLLIAGEGRLMSLLQRRTRKLGLEDRVDFLGFISDMPGFFNSIDIFLLPSHFEGFSNAVIEAMASARPVVAFDVGSTAEVIRDGKTGYIIRDKSVQEMSGKILELASNKELRRSMGREGRKRVEESFSFETCLEKIIQVITPVQT
jgi:glycosyltransferase involved in cell wall biosynthesis